MKRDKSNVKMFILFVEDYAPGINECNELLRVPSNSTEQRPETIKELEEELKEVSKLVEEKLKIKSSIWTSYVTICKDTGALDKKRSNLNKEIEALKTTSQEVKYYFDQVYMNQKGEKCIIQLSPSTIGRDIKIYNVSTHKVIGDSFSIVTSNNYIRESTLSKIDPNNTYSLIKI